MASQKGEGCSQQKITPFSAYNPNSYCQIIPICLGMGMVMKKELDILKLPMCKNCNISVNFYIVTFYPINSVKIEV